MSKLKIGIIGHGFVGKAVDAGFNRDVDKYVVDPLNGTSIKSMYAHFTPDIVFIAVPTPMGADGTIDSSIIEGVFAELVQQETQPIAVIKSTVTSAVISRLKQVYSRIIFNPEFLTERNAAWDFINADMLVIGGVDQVDMNFVKDVYDNHSECKPCPVHFVDLEAAAMIKYTINSFLATKVLFFNQLNDVFAKSSTAIEWDAFTSIVSTDKRIGTSHMAVPGPDGRRGYGGACFPKDTTALVRLARDYDVPFTALEETIRVNQAIRGQYTELDAREIAQNVSFNIL
jgi:UDPglucose 6-dehydrogenase